MHLVGQVEVVLDGFLVEHQPGQLMVLSVGQQLALWAAHFVEWLVWSVHGVGLLLLAESGLWAGWLGVVDAGVGIACWLVVDFVGQFDVVVEGEHSVRPG